MTWETYLAEQQPRYQDELAAIPQHSQHLGPARACRCCSAGGPLGRRSPHNRWHGERAHSANEWTPRRLCGVAARPREADCDDLWPL